MVAVVFLLRFLALWLTLSLGLPHSAFALRDSIEDRTPSDIAARLQAGAEESELLVLMAQMETGVRLYVQQGLLDPELVAALRFQEVEVKEFLLSDIPEVNPQETNVFVAAIQPDSEQEERMHRYGSTLINLYGSKPIDRPQTPTALATLIRAVRRFDGLLRLEGITVDEALGLASLDLTA